MSPRAPLRSSPASRVALAVCSALLAAAPLAAQASLVDTGHADTADDPSPPFVPAAPFSWTTAATNVGPVHVPVGPGGGWIVTAQGQWRLIPSQTPDPTFEVILFAPYSGHPTANERFLLQVPVNSQGEPLDAGALVIGFHAANLTEANVFQGTDLPDVCYDRRWMLIAPYGLSQVNFANVNSQNALDAILEVVDRSFDFDEQRIYTVGFSMGGMNAVSWAMRHLDPDGYRVAGIVNHTGTMDAVLVYNNGNGSLKALLANTEHFNGTPTTDLFSYDRVCPIRMEAGAANPNKAPVTNLAAHVPVYVHYNTLDPNANLVQETQALITWLQGLGANVLVDTAAVEATHWWSTMDMDAAMEWVGRYRLPEDPASFSIFADQEVPYLDTSALDIAPQTLARYSFALGTGNDFDVFDSKALRKVGLDMAGLGLDPAQTLTFDADTIDGTTDVFVLEGYAAAPSSVLEGASPATWSHYPARRELVITPSSAPASFTVTP